MQNAIQMLKSEHKEVEDLFDKFQNSNDLESKRELVEKIFSDLIVHTKLEEEIFYPTIREKIENSEIESLVTDGFEDHDEAKNQIEKLREMEISDDTYEQEFQKLIKSVKEHVQEEEEELFPRVESQMTDQLDELGARMKDQRKELVGSES